MTWEDYCRVMLCIGKLDGLRQSLPAETADWLDSIIDLLSTVVMRYCPGRTREYGQENVMQEERDADTPS